jgi:hypothetical protein
MDWVGLPVPIRYSEMMHFKDIWLDSLDGWICPALRPLPKQGNIEEMQWYMHALRGIRTHDFSVWESEDISCHRSSGHYDRRTFYVTYIKTSRNLKLLNIKNVSTLNDEMWDKLDINST